MTSKIERDGNDIVCHGYMRQNVDTINDNNIYMFPTAIILIIIRYFEEYFEFDPDYAAQGIVISNNNLAARSDLYHNKQWVSKNILNGDKYNNVEWEVTIKYFKDNKMCLAFGFVDAPLETSMPNVHKTEFLAGSHQNAIYIHYTNNTFKILGHGSAIGNNSIYNTKCSDVMILKRRNVIFFITINFVRH